MKIFLSCLLLSLALIACTEGRVKKYRDILEPRIGTGKKDEIDKLLGNPAWCKEEGGAQKCEYRSSRANNEPVPDVYRRNEGMGPDVSPYDRFDVLHLQYDGFGVLKEWEPVMIPH